MGKGENKMTRYIDINNINLRGIAVFDQDFEALIPLSDVRMALQMTPTADVQEVRHGKWEKCKECCCEYRCSVCEYELCRTTNYCPNCGAKMDGEEDHNG